MAYNTKAIKKDVDGKPVPQVYNPVTDDYEVLQGVQGGNRVVLHDAAGNAVAVATEATLAALAGQADIKLSALRDALIGVDDKTIGDLATLLTAIKDTSGIKKITDAVDVSDRAARALGAVTVTGSLPSVADDLRGLAADRPAADAGNKGKTYWSLDTGDVSVSTGTAWRSVGVV